MSVAFQVIELLSPLESLCRRLAREKAIAVDIEADSFHHYTPKVCLIQVSTKDQTYVIDPLALETMTPLLRVLSNSHVEKIFHGADYDLRSLYRDYGVKVAPVYDTMIASQFLGENDVGLAAVLKKRFDVTLDKKYQKADWSKRPIPREMLVYAAHDTAYLIPLWKALKRELVLCNRLDWVEEEFRLLSAGCCRNDDNELPVTPRSTTDDSDLHEAKGHMPLFRRFKGAGTMPRRELAVLERILAYREARAQRQDRPTFKVFSNKLIKDLVSKKPTDLQALEKVPALPRGFSTRHGKGVVKAIKEGLALPESRLPKFPKTRRPPANPGKQARLKRLKQWREKKAAQLDLDPGLVCNNALLETLADTTPPPGLKTLAQVSGIKQWQHRVLGQEMVDVLRATK